MIDGEYSLSIDEAIPSVTFDTTSLKGAKAGLAELKKRRKLVVFRRRERMAQLRVERSLYWGTREISRSIGGGFFSEIIQSISRFSAYSKTAKTDVEIANIDRILIAIDRAIMGLEAEIARLKI